MPDFRFYSSSLEARQALEAAMNERRLHFLPDRNFATRTPQTSSALGIGFWERLRNRQFFVMGDFTVEPIVYHLIDGGAYAGSYTVNQQLSGPLIEVVLPPDIMKNGVMHLTIGSVGYHKEFWTESLGRRYPPPKSLVVTYQEILRTLKLHLRRQKLSDGTTVWIGRKSCELLVEGRAVVESKGKWVKSA